MADAIVPADMHDLWMGILTIGGIFMGYFLKKRDRDIDTHATQIEERVREHARLELQVTKDFATKESLRMLFQETQTTNRETAARLEGQIKETKLEMKQELKATNDKLDTMQNAIMTELAKKT